MPLWSQLSSAAAWSAAWPKVGGRGAGLRRRKTPLSLQSCSGNGMRAECRLDWRCHALLLNRWQAGVMSSLGGERRRCRRRRPQALAWFAMYRVDQQLSGAGLRRREATLSLQSCSGTGIRAECRRDWLSYGVLPSRWLAGSMPSFAREDAAAVAGVLRHRHCVPCCGVSSTCVCRCMV